MMLLQSVVNSVAVFVSLSIRVALGNRQNGRRGDSALGYLLESVARVVLTLLGTLVCAYFSRRRDSMIRALQRLGQMRPTPLPGNLRAFGISGGMGALFARHPPLEKRIDALRA